jgi:hypothetical protein
MPPRKGTSVKLWKTAHENSGLIIGGMYVCPSTEGLSVLFE